MWPVPAAEEVPGRLVQQPPAWHTGGGSVTRDNYATVAYNVRTGARLWVRRYIGPARPRAHGGDSATALAARGGRVFVTGGSTGTTSGDDFATIA